MILFPRSAIVELENGAFGRVMASLLDLVTGASAGAGAGSRSAAEISPKAVVRIGAARADLARGRVIAADGTVIELRPKTAALLEALAARPGEIVTKDELLERVWPGVYVDEDALVQCVGEIRRALGPDRDAVRTHAKRGYSLELTVAEPELPPVSRARFRRALAALLVALAGAAGLVAALASRAPAPPAALAGFAGPVVAVLPFEALPAEDRWQRLARALTEDVVADLGRNAWLFVFADAATRALPDATVAAARDLGAGYAVTGSVKVEGGDGRVDAALVETGTGRHLWSRRFEGPVESLPVLQRAAAEAIVGELAASWTGPISLADKARARGRGVDELEPYELYLRAGERMATYTPEGLREAEEMLMRLVAMEPGFGEAWAKLSLVSYNRVDPEMSAAQMEALWEQGNAAALEAYRVAPDRPNALGQAANVVRWTDPEKAEEMIRRAAALAPNDADILAYLAFRAAHFPALGPEAEGWIARAILLNPARPDWYDWNRGAVMMVTGDYAEAAASYARAPNHVAARGAWIAALALAGEAEAARRLWAEVHAAAPHFSPAWLAEAEGFHPDVAAIFDRGFALAAGPADAGAVAAGGGGR
jgi:TolB-like protein/DNA-binding winged helix-turn-helix (wHTH) protein